MSYRIGRLSRDARNERRRMRRLHAITPSMERAIAQVIDGETPAARAHTISALVRREILTDDGDGLALTERGAFVALMVAA